MHENRSRISHGAMLQSFASKCAKVVCSTVFAFSLMGLAGCAQPQQMQGEGESQVTPSDYMIKVNATSEQLSSTLSEFAQAVADDDVFAMQAKADAAYEILDQMEEIEAPDAMSDVKSKYSDAASSLKDALGDYLALYVEMDDAKQNASFDYSNYSSRLEQIQKEYDEGIGELEEADKQASEKQAADGQSSSSQSSDKQSSDGSSSSE